MRQKALAFIKAIGSILVLSPTIPRPTQTYDGFRRDAKAIRADFNKNLRS